MRGQHRQACLQALGVTLWERRNRSAAPAATHAEPSAAPSPEGGAGPVPLERMDLAQLREAVAGCHACDLAQGRTRTVFGVGDPDAGLVVIGEAPGAQEDRQGEPFVGRAGKLLDAMLRAMGRSRGHDVFITNIVKCRPPKNRDPKPEEADACAGYLHRQLELVRPRLILAVGRIAAQRLLQTDASIGRLRGRVHRYGPDAIPLVVSYHPAYLLRSPQEKRKAWADLKLAMRELGDADQ
ncbi:MAG TPA: uracil-DNA glycosylase [Gammaproteobacteria bacterium]|nr:uracil-DNA glycosylase [Gammaproteobacteria bacterium]